MGSPIPTAESRADVGTEFLSTYPPHTHTHGDPHTHGRVQGCRGNGISIAIPTPYPYTWGAPYPRQSPGLMWGRNFYPHTHTIPIHMGSPISTADLPYVHVSVEYFSRSTPQFQLRFTVLHTQPQSHNITITRVTLMVFLMHT